MRPFKLSLLVLLAGILSCTAQKKYELVLNIKDSAPTLDQLDSTVNVLKKRLQAYDKGNTLINRSPNQQSITLQTACGDLDFIGHVLVKKGRLVFYECYTLDVPDIATGFQKADEALSRAIQQNQPILEGISTSSFNATNPLLRIFNLQQPYTDRSGGTTYPPSIAIIADSLIPLFKSCWPLLYKHLPQGSMCLLKPLDNTKYKVHEIYLVKNDATAFDASSYIANALADLDDRNKPVVTMSFNKVGAQLWKRMTAKNVGKNIAIVVDDQLLSAPTVISAIEGGNTQISGSFTFEQTQDIANTLRNGYLPLTLQIGSIKLVPNK